MVAVLGYETLRIEGGHHGRYACRQRRVRIDSGD